MSASSDVVHDQVSMLPKAVDQLGTEPGAHSPKQEAPPVSTDGNAVEAESFEFEVLTPYDQEPEIDLKEGVLKSLDIGGSAEVFPSSAHVGLRHGASAIGHDSMVDFRPQSHRLRWLVTEPMQPLIADVHLAKSRLVITKTHCLYPEKPELIPYPSCLIGFRLVLHPSHRKARIKHVKIELTLNQKEAEPTGSPIEIQSIYPLDGEIHETGQRTLVHAVQENSAEISVGVNPYGTATLNRAQSVAHDSYTAPYVLSSGRNTNILQIIMEEDSSSKGGVITWSLEYDGQTELGNSEFGT